MWEHFPHEADMGVRGIGATVEEAFQEAARALVALTTDLDGVRPQTAIEIACEADDIEALLVEWLDAVVFEMATRGMVFGRFEVRIDETRLEGTAWGEERDDRRHEVGVEVKGPTFTALRVARDDEGRWLAQTVVDV